MNLRKQALKLIDEERSRQDHKWGKQRHTDEVWLMILAEEFGELAQAMQRARGWGKDSDPDNKMEEVTHVGAVSVALLEQYIEYSNRVDSNDSK